MVEAAAEVRRKAEALKAAEDARNAAEDARKAAAEALKSAARHKAAAEKEALRKASELRKAEVRRKAEEKAEARKAKVRQKAWEKAEALRKKMAKTPLGMWCAENQDLLFTLQNSREVVRPIRAIDSNLEGRIMVDVLTDYQGIFKPADQLTQTRRIYKSQLRDRYVCNVDREQCERSNIHNIYDGQGKAYDGYSTIDCTKKFTRYFVDGPLGMGIYWDKFDSVVRVSSLSAGQAPESGVQKGDIILSIGGLRVKSYDECLDVLSEGGTRIITFLRDNCAKRERTVRLSQSDRLKHLQTLGLQDGATKKEIKRAYGKLAMKTHPDKTGGSVEEFQAIGEAYEALIKDLKAGEEEKAWRAEQERAKAAQG